MAIKLPYKPLIFYVVATSLPLHAQLLVTEINSNGTGGDFWELTNVGTSSIDLSNYKWNDSARSSTGTAVTIPAGTVINAGESIIFNVTGDANAFRTAWNLTTSVKVISGGPGLGQNDAITLYDAAGTELLFLSYAGNGFTRTNGSGAVGGHAGASAGGVATVSMVWNPAFGIETTRRYSAASITEPGNADSPGCFAHPTDSLTIGSPGVSGFGAPPPSVTLTVSATPNIFSESAANPASTGTVTRTGSTAAELVINLSSSDTTEANVPSSVTIPIGATSANFVISAVNDSFPDGNKSVTLTASASGATSGISTITVNDDADVYVQKLLLTEVLSQQSATGVNDFWELTNISNETVSLEGYSWHDSGRSASAAQAYKLPAGSSIAPGESVIFTNVSATDFRNWWGISNTVQVFQSAAPGLGQNDGVSFFDEGQNEIFFFSYAANGFTRADGSTSTGTHAGPSAGAGTDTQSLVWVPSTSPSSPRYTFATAGSLGASASSLNANDIGSPGRTNEIVLPPSSVSVSIATSVSVAEGSSGTAQLVFPVTRSVDTTGFSVDYAISGGTATSGTDFTPIATGTLTFPANSGPLVQNITIDVLGDTIIESNETIVITLSNLVQTTGTTVLGTSNSTGTITNDDTVVNVFPASNSITGTVKGSITLAGAEIPAFDPVSKRAFAASGTGIQVVDLTNPATPVFIENIKPSTLGVAGLTNDDISSISLRKGNGSNPSILAAAIINSPKTNNGHVVFLNAATGAVLGSTTVGAVPDHIGFTPDGTKLLVCNEGELDGSSANIATENSPGSVSIIDVTNIAALTVQTAGFASFNSQAAALKTAGVRLFDGGIPEFDFEPEYLAISPDGTKAMVTLQEANAVAVLDIATATFTSVVPLGEKDFSTGRYDFSDRDGAGASTLVNPTLGNPVFGLYMPDAIASYQVNGQTYYVTANEGDDRNDFIEPNETTTVSNAAYDLDNTLFPNETSLKNAASLGRLVVSNPPGLRGDTDNDGDIDRILSYGGRSFSILDANGAQVFDSGDMIEMIVASQFPSLFDDGRSDNKGPEPEGVVVAKIGSRTFAFVGLERSHLTLAFDVTNPLAPTYATAFRRAGDLNPEGMVVVEATDSPSGKPLLIVASEVSNTLSVFEINQAVDFTLQLLHLADAEAGLLASQTAPNLAALVDAFDQSKPNTLILAGGDNFIPGPFLAGGTDISVRDELNVVSGSTINMATNTNHPIAAVDIAIHNVIGVEASTIGNHEFDLGTRVFSDAIRSGSVTGWAGANFPYLSANLDFSADGDLSGRFTNTLSGNNTTLVAEASTLKGRIAPSAVITKGGEKIGLVGVTTQILESISSTGGVEVRGFTGDGAETNDMALLASQIQPAIDELRSEGVNKIILMAHLQQITFEQQLAPLLNGVDIILAAGSNTRLGDSNDVAAAFTGHSANFAANYPIYTAGSDGAPTVIVNTDNEFTYLGRLVADFDADGRLIVPNLTTNTVENGAYAATDANVAAAWNTTVDNLGTTAFAAGTKGALVKQLTDAVQSVIIAKDGSVRGYTDVYLEGERNIVRNQETNLGNITADSMVSVTKTALPSASHIVAFKNGGGIRSAIGAVEVGSGLKTPPIANPAANKPAGAISLLDIENSLRFNNGLMVCDTTPAGLKAILEHGVASLGNQGRFPQIGGVRFSYNPAATAGSRVLNVALVNENDQITAQVITAGAVAAGAPATITLTTLNFLAQGGDSYPFKANADNFRYLLNDGSVTSVIAETLDFGAAANVPTNILGEQVALSNYLQSRYASPASAFNIADTAAALDTRIQSTAVRTDSTLTGPATFAAWLAQNGYTSSGMNADSDNDGIADRIEYFFNQSPNSGADQRNMPMLATNGQARELTFSFNNQTTLSGMLQVSSDLTTWENGIQGIDFTLASAVATGSETTVTYALPGTGPSAPGASATYTAPNAADPAGASLGGVRVINQGLVGVGRLSGNAVDSFGETQGAASGLAISDWAWNGNQFSGKFQVLPDRGYNAGTIFSNYAARLHEVNFTFTPYYGTAPVAQGQINPTYVGSTKFTYMDGTSEKLTSGLNPTATSTLLGQTVGTVMAANGPGGSQQSLLSLDAEAVHLFADGSGYVSDEYGTYICRFNKDKVITGITQLPTASRPHASPGVLNFTSNTTPVSGRRQNQGLEGMSVTPDGTRLFAVMQSALVQDTNGNNQQTRNNTRLYVYDVAGANRENPVLIGQYVVKLPQISTALNAAVSRTAAQSEIVALNSTSFLMLPRDGNGLGTGSAAAIMFKSVQLVDFASATNILGNHDAEAAAVSPLGVLPNTVKAAASAEVINMLESSDLAKFGLNTNTATPNANTLNEKMEGMALVPDLSTVQANDFFLFVANDNDFQSSDVKMLGADGNFMTGAMGAPLDGRSNAGNGALTNDAMFYAYRITIDASGKRFFRFEVK